MGLRGWLSRTENLRCLRHVPFLVNRLQILLLFSSSVEGSKLLSSHQAVQKSAVRPCKLFLALPIALKHLIDLLNEVVFQILAIVLCIFDDDARLLMKIV
jgi:hypothetical protein